MGGRLVLQNPSLWEAYEALRLRRSREDTVLIIGECSVKYDGRASSTLEPGERIVLIKSDRSLQVHRPFELSPVNWQPSGSILRVRIQEGLLFVRSYNPRGRESLEVVFSKLVLLAVLGLRDTGSFFLHASEEDMRSAILRQPSILEEGFKPLAVERKIEPGFVDILGLDGKGVLTAVEIKRNDAGRDAVLQLKRYVDSLRMETGKEVRGIIAAPGLARGAQSTLSSLGLEFKVLSPQRCGEIIKQSKERKMTDFLI
ncbi:MAG: endonuclease NucS [Candidatus Bathyarchaeia archaeon]